jgi:hypothetical protein
MAPERRKIYLKKLEQIKFNQLQTESNSIGLKLPLPRIMGIRDGDKEERSISIHHFVFRLFS